MFAFTYFVYRGFSFFDRVWKKNSLCIKEQVTKMCTSMWHVIRSNDFELRQLNFVHRQQSPPLLRKCPMKQCWVAKMPQKPLIPSTGQEALTGGLWKILKVNCAFKF